MSEKNRPRRHVPNRTSGQKRPEEGDRRVRRTKSSLHEALIGLAREKPYSAIAVKEILDRANVGRSTFYMHFRDKDDLLESGIHDVLRSIEDRPRSGGLDQVVAFSLPLLTHIDGHRRTPGPHMSRDGRVVMHRHLQEVLTKLVADELALMKPDRWKPLMPADLVARHVAATFVLVLDWWVENDMPLTPARVDAHFRALALPVLARITTS